MIRGEESAARPRAASYRAWRDACCVALAVTHSCGCLSGGPARGSPLYPSGGAPLALSQVAALDGYVAAVDGRDVTQLAPPFELLPGCHVVHTPERWTAVNSGDVAAVAQTGQLTFALPMRAGHFYQIEARAELQTSISGKLDILGIERDASGRQTRVFGSLKGRAERGACHEAGTRISFEARVM